MFVLADYYSEIGFKDKECLDMFFDQDRNKDQAISRV
jgi:hypothetical protein